jgi:uncharacterized protein (TIGR01319 family)
MSALPVDQGQIGVSGSLHHPDLPLIDGGGLAVCVDVGSTYTKVAVVELDSGVVVATASRPTTVDTDVLHGLDEAVAATGVREPVATYVCSSAGGGLRLAVVGYERLVTAEAGHRVGLSAGARVVHVAAGPLDRAGVDELRAARPDVVLLVGGTDGGDAAVLRHNAHRLAVARLRVPVVAAGNEDARDEVVDELTRRNVAVIPAGNVLPRIGVANPVPARTAIREVFLRHVIGGKKLSRGPRFTSLVRGATPDVVFTAVELLADHHPGDLLVVDVGGATTDVYSALTPDENTDVAGTLWRSRTVEGDLGVRWTAPGVLDAAAAERLLDGDPAVGARLHMAAQERSADPGLPAGGPDLRLASLAATVALRRHARGEPVGRTGQRRGGRDLREVRLVIGSGGVLRHADRAEALRALGAALADHSGGWLLPRAATVTVDADYVLAPAGLLAAEHPRVALRLLERLAHGQ